MRVVLRGGTYYLDEPLEFGPEDSGRRDAPVVYAAAAGEKVVLSGGRRLTGGRWGEVNGRKAWIVDIPEVKEGKWRFRQLFVNGDRRPRTRLPKQGEYRIESLPGYTGDFLRSPTKQFVYAPGNIVPTWRNLRDVEVVGITRWLDNRLPIESVNGETRTVTFDRPSLFALVSSAPWGDSTATPSVYWVENVFEALDTPGQWYLDRPQGRLYYLPQPGEDMASAEIIAPRLTQVVRVVGRAGRAGARPPLRRPHVFAHRVAAAGRLCLVAPGRNRSARRALVRLRRTMRRHRRRHRTHRQLRRRGERGLRGHRDLAQPDHGYRRGGNPDRPLLLVGDGRVWPADRAGTAAQGRHAHRARTASGSPWPTTRSPTAGGSPRKRWACSWATTPTTRSFTTTFTTCSTRGISVGSVQDFGPSQAQGNIIEYNHIHDIGQGMLSDLAGIYTCSTPGSRIRYNVVHDVSRRDYGGWGIYPDQGSHDLLIQKNLVYRCQDGALFAHHNRNITAENNIFAFNRAAQIERYGIGGFELTCRRNLVYYQEGKAVGDYGSGHCGRDVCAFRPQPLLERLRQAGPLRRQDASPSGRRRARTRTASSPTRCLWTRSRAISGCGQAPRRRRSASSRGTCRPLGRAHNPLRRSSDDGTVPIWP